MGELEAELMEARHERASLQREKEDLQRRMEDEGTGGPLFGWDPERSLQT